MTRELVSQTATCKRCGSETVTWQTSAKTGKYYLTEVFDYDGIEKTDRRDFHSNYCGKPELHKAEQDEINGDYAERDQAVKKAVARREEETVNHFLALHDRCKSMPDVARAEVADLERRVEYEKRNWISMDTMTDAMNQRAEVKSMETEIKFMRAALGMDQDQD